MRIEADDMERVRAPYLRGLFVQAHDTAARVAPIREWEGTAARLLAGRLAMQVGAPRLGSALHELAWRADPADAEAIVYRARVVFRRHGPLAALRFLREADELRTDDVEVLADRVALEAEILSALRDFDRAERLVEQAESLAPRSPWILVEKATVLSLQDRYPEALDAANRSLRLRPWFVPAVQTAATLLQFLDRDAEALELLESAARETECAGIVVHLARVQSEMGRHGEVLATLDRAEALSPLLDRETARTLDALRSDAACDCGDIGAAAEFARRSRSPFHLAMLPRLERTGLPRVRVRLDVCFVRQHHETCSPATLAAIAAFWSKPVEHLEVADRICYDGTTAQSERLWAEANGWLAREFTVDWSAATALLDRGIPFTLTTVHPGGGHAQAVIGYDTVRGTLLLRDPTYRHYGEGLAEPLFEQQRAYGPRGMALVPQERADLLGTLDLPDEKRYDQLYRVGTALLEHRRSDAAGLLREMEEEASEHRLTHHARLAVASYDADREGMLGCIGTLLRLFPGDERLTAFRANLLRELLRSDERMALLRSLCADPASDPAVRLAYARELSVDAWEQNRAIAILRPLIRAGGTPAAEALEVLARIQWSRG